MKTKKELINEYKERKARPGIFQIRNLSNNKALVASSTDLDTAWNSQLFQLRNDLHSSQGLQQDWKNEGEQNFVFEELSEIKEENDIVDYRKELKQLEKMFIEELSPFYSKGNNSNSKQ